MPRAESVPNWEIPACGLYLEHPQRQRDEALRIVLDRSMALIDAAIARPGFTPMIGFEAQAWPASPDELRTKCRLCCCP